MSISLRPLAVAALALMAAPLAAQDQAAAPALPPANVCGQQIAPRAQPVAGSGPVVLFIAPCFEAQGNASVIEAQTYLYYIQQKFSAPSQNQWVLYDDTSEKTIQDDFHRLWNTNFLDNLWIDVSDYTFPNGTIGKIVTYNMEERQRVKIVDYVGSKKIEVSKIDEKLKDASAQIRLDSFIDPGLVRKVEGIVRDMLREKGFQFADVTHEIKEIPGGPKLVHLTFNMDEGPKVKIRKIEFVGNKAISDGALKRQMKENSERGRVPGLRPLSRCGSCRSSATRAPTRKRSSTRTPRRSSPTTATTATCAPTSACPSSRCSSDSDDKKTRWVELRIPITEGARYKVGTFDVAGQHRRQDRLPEAALQDDAGRVLRREAHPQGPRESARGLRHRRLLRVHRLSRLQVPRRPEPERARGARRAEGARAGKPPRARRSST